MTTMEMPVDNRRPTPAGTRFVDVRANLMPTEILTARRTEAVRNRVLIALGALVVVIALAFAGTWWQTHSARGDLDDLNTSIAADQAEQASSSFARLAQDQAQMAEISTQLTQVMATDLPWYSLLTTLRSVAPAGVQIASVAASTGATAGSATAGSTSTSGSTSTTGSGTATGATTAAGATTAGTLTLTGTAPDPASVAAWSDTLGKVKGVTSVLITSVTGASNGSAGGGRTNGVSYSMTASLTSALLGGRFTKGN